MFGSRLISIIQLGDTGNSRLASTIRLLEFLHLLKPGECQEFISDPSLESVLDKTFRCFKLTPKIWRL